MRAVVFNYYKWLLPTFEHFYDLEYPLDVYESENPWSNSVIEVLGGMDENILLIMDDYILKKTHPKVITRADELCKGDVGCVKLNAHNRHKKHLIKIGIDGFKQYPNDAPYSMNLQISVWQPKGLLKVLKRNETPWQVENEGSKRIKTKILWSDTPGVEYAPTGCMQRGKPIEKEFKWINENW